MSPGWFTNGLQAVHGVTQTCRTKSVDRDNVAYFSYPFSFELVYQRDPLLEKKQGLSLTVSAWIKIACKLYFCLSAVESIACMAFAVHMVIWSVG